MKISNTIFQHLFVRVAVILLGISIAFSFALIPIYNDKLIRMLATQGNTFANTTLAACSEALYIKDFSFVITNVNKSLNKTPEIIHVDFLSKDGMILHLTADGWSVGKSSKAKNGLTPKNEQPYSIEHVKNHNIRDKTDVFIFSKPINISGLDWGAIEIGISDREYDALLYSYFRNVLISSLILLAISLLILRGLSMKLGLQLARLRETAVKLSDGDLAARAPVKAIGEIQLLATTLNSMAKNLESKSRSVRQLAKLVEDTHDAIAIFNAEKKISFVNPAFTKITDNNHEFYQGMTLQVLLDHLGIDKKKQREVSAGITHVEQLDWSTDITISPSGSNPIHMTLRIEAFDNEQEIENVFFVVLSDITRRKQLEFELETLAYIDKLTKLPNRRFFMDKLSEAVKEAGVFSTGLSVFFLDLDNFKIINDSLGHETGDHVLSESAWRIQDTLRSDDIVCRLGGDEFTIIIKNVASKDELKKIAKTLINEFSNPIDCKDRELRISTSIGIVQYPHDGNDAKELIKNADTAMYAAKHNGKNGFRFFTQDMQKDMRDHLEIENDLRKALQTSDLYLVYQPFVKVETQSIKSCEALLRWKHPERGIIPPGRFISIAEQSGLIGELGFWVFTEVCKQLKHWEFDIQVSINVSAKELLDKNFVDRLRHTLVEYDLEPNRFQLEFTENVLVNNDGRNLSILNELKRTGFKIAIDDFGTGFSSLSYLTELPIDVIKIDKTFISKLPHDHRTIAVVNSIISLASSLNMMTIGEGAENKAQVDWLRAHGCHTIQGYYYHKPLLPEELEKLICGNKISHLKLTGKSTSIDL